MAMAHLQNLDDLFYDQLKEAYDIESQLVEALPEMEKNTRNNELKEIFSQHREEAKNQQTRLQEIADDMGIDLSGEKSDAMEGMIRRTHKLLSEDAEDNVKDAGLIADVQRMKHYEMAVYGTAREYANSIDRKDVADKLNQSLEEESNVDKRLSEIAVNNINPQAKM